MSMNELDRLIARVDSGAATDADLLHLGDLLAAFEAANPLPLGGAVAGEAGRYEVDRAVLGALGVADDLPLYDAVGYEAGTIDVADVVLAVISDDLPLADAVRAELESELPLFAAIAGEAGGIDIAGDVLAALGLREAVPPLREALRAEAGLGPDVAAEDPFDLPVAQAVRAEAGSVEVADAVMCALGVADDLPIFDAVHAEAGSVDLADAVMRALGVAEGLPLAEAVRAEAGSVDVTAAVMTAVRRSAVAPSPTLPVGGANWGLGWASLALAAMALFAVLLGREVWTAGAIDAPIAPTAALEPEAEPMHFAAVDEIRVDDLSYGATVSVQLIQDEADEGPLIIWVEEEQTL